MGSQRLGHDWSDLARTWIEGRGGLKKEGSVTHSYLGTQDNGRGFPGSSVGKESACYAGDRDSIPGSGKSTGEEIGYPLQYAWASLVAQLVKNPPAMWETWVQSLDNRGKRIMEVPSPYMLSKPLRQANSMQWTIGMFLKLLQEVTPITSVCHSLTKAVNDHVYFKGN